MQREVLTRGIVATVSGTTVWRWLAADAIRPWRHRSWLFPRDPAFAAKAGPILDLYAGQPLPGHADRASPAATDAGRTWYRIFFTVDQTAKVVRVVHVRRGARQRPTVDELKDE